MNDYVEEALKHTRAVAAYLEHCLSIKPDEPDKAGWPPYDDWEKQPDLDDGVVRYHNSRYAVSMVSDPTQELMPGIACEKLLIQNSDQSAKHDWRDFQRIKNDLLGSDWEAVELYPRQDRVVDPSNAFMLYCFPKTLPFGVTVGIVHGPTDSMAPQRKLDEDAPTVGVKKDLDEGIGNDQEDRSGSTGTGM